MLVLFSYQELEIFPWINLSLLMFPFSHNYQVLTIFYIVSATLVLGDNGA